MRMKQNRLVFLFIYMTDFNSEDIEKIKKLLPCATDRIQINDHETRIRLIEDAIIKMNQILMGEGKSILYRVDKLENIEFIQKKDFLELKKKIDEMSDYLMKHESDIESLRGMKETVGIQKFLSSGLFKVFLVLLGAAAGAVISHFL